MPTLPPTHSFGPYMNSLEDYILEYSDRLYTATPAYGQSSATMTSTSDFGSTSPSIFTESRSSTGVTSSSSFPAGHQSHVGDLDYEILNDVSGLEDFDFNSDWVLFQAPIDLNYSPQSLFSDAPVASSTFSNNTGALNQWLNLSPSEPLFVHAPDDEALSLDPHVAHHTCEFCQEGFQKRHELNRHVLKHTKPYSCIIPACGASFAEKRGCERHMKARHNVENPNSTKCRFCSYNSTRSDAVQRHLRTRHGVQVSFQAGVSPATTTMTTKVE